MTYIGILKTQSSPIEDTPIYGMSHFFSVKFQFNFMTLCQSYSSYFHC